MDIGHDGLVYHTMRIIVNVASPTLNQAYPNHGLLWGLGLQLEKLAAHL